METNDMTPAKQKFKLGDRVRLSDEGRKQGLCRPRRNLGPSDRGVVVGFGPEPNTVEIQRDNRMTTYKYHKDYWEKDE